MADEKSTSLTQEDTGRVLQQSVVPGAIKPRHLVVSPLALGDIYYSSGTDFVNLPIGAENYSLIVSSGVPAWSLVPVSGITPGSNNQVLSTLSGTVQWANRIADYLATTTNPVDVKSATAPSTGDVLTATDATHATWQAPSGGSGNVSLLFAQTEDVTVSNTTSETTLIGTGAGSVTLAGGFFTAGKTLRIIMSGTLGAEATNSSSLDIEIYLGSTPITFTGVQNIIDANGGFWGLNVLLTCRTTGATGTIIGAGSSLYQANEALADLLTEANVFGLNEGEATIDTTASQTLDITATWDTADAANIIVSSVFTLESLG